MNMLKMIYNEASQLYEWHNVKGEIVTEWNSDVSIDCPEDLTPNRMIGDLIQEVYEKAFKDGAKSGEVPKIPINPRRIFNGATAEYYALSFRKGFITTVEMHYRSIETKEHLKTEYCLLSDVPEWVRKVFYKQEKD